MVNQSDKTRGFRTFLDHVLEGATTPQKRTRHVTVTQPYLNGNSGFTRREFYELLKECKFVARVIDIHTRDQARLGTCGNSSRNNFLKTDDTEWQTLVTDNLADWLFWITDILTVQARFVSSGRPLTRSQLAALLHDRFIGHPGRNLRLKDRRNEIWSAYSLRSAVEKVLPDIKSCGAVTLSNLARRINARSRDLSFVSLKTPLSGRHLQKLLKKHHIDWIEIKRSYKERLLTQGR